MRHVHHDAGPLLARLTGGRLDPPDWQRVCVLAHQISLTRAIEHLESLDRLDTGRIQILPHQVETVLAVLQRMGGRAILADEVGLGKTIEAGLVFKELVVRGLVRRALILVPAPLTTQWQAELDTKFGEQVVVGDRSRDPAFRGWEAHDRMVVSLDTAKLPQHAEMLSALDWDLVIVDEAHRLKNPQTTAYRFVQGLRSRFKLFLSATPIQNSLFELFHLVNLLSEGAMGTLDAFKGRFIEDARGRVLRDAEGLSALLRRVMVRHRRSEVGLRFVERRVETFRLMPTPAELDLHDDVIRYLGRAMNGSEPAGMKALAFIRLSRMLSSSPRALAATLETMARGTTMEDAAELRELARRARGVPGSTKLEALCAVIAQADERVLVFTSFRETIAHLEAHLGEHGVRTLTFHGGLTQREKDAVIARFRAEGGVLLCTDAGSEGVNLQFCHTLVNFDLPWNPMRVEQRIGRIHRIGQERDVAIVNLTLQGTIEEHMLAILEQKIQLFTQAVGETDLILSQLKQADRFEHTLLELIARARDRRELEAGFDAWGRDLETARQAAEKLREFDSKTLALLDLSALHG
jgi:SNF2 family DNA or RNA helicase